MLLLYVGAFGLAGVYSRYFLSLALDSRADSSLPLGTLAVNLIGAFLAGSIVAAGHQYLSWGTELRTGILVGFLGGFTTFSALCLQTVQLAEKGQLLQATSYFAFSNVAGLGCVWLGMFFARWLTAP